MKQRGAGACHRGITMTLTDCRNLALSGATPAALDVYEQASAQLLCYRGDPLATIEGALTQASGFAMAHAFKGYLGVLGTEVAGFALAAAQADILDDLSLTPREMGHRKALRALSQGDWDTGMLTLDRVLADHPHDILALQVLHVSSFFVGDARTLRDSVARVRGAWDPRQPGYHALLGMHAFGLEECGDYARAEHEGQRAIQLEPYDAWAQHAVAHVYEMQNRTEDGVHWMTSREPYWAVDNFFAIHNVWHLALYLLEQGDMAAVLDLYDRRIRGTRSQVVLDMIDASALLFRLHLRGVPLGDRSTELADAWKPLARDGLYAFNDAHAAMAFIGAGRSEDLAALRETMQAQAERTGPSANARMTREVGLPVVDALSAFARDDHGTAVELLRGVLPRAHRFGGSHAQRDLLDHTLAEAAVRAGDHALARALVRERKERRPNEVFARMIAQRVSA